MKFFEQTLNKDGTFLVSLQQMETADWRNTLSKDERLYHNKRIDQLFKDGESFISYPLRIVYTKHQSDDAPDVCMMVSVSKKKFKRAVKRNRIKRLVKEAFRLNKSGFQTVVNQNNTKLDVAFLYLKNELCSFDEIEKAILKTVLLLEGKLSPAPQEVKDDDEKDNI